MRVDVPPHYIPKDSNFDLRYVRLCNLDIPREVWVNYLQTVETRIRHRILRQLIWVCTFASYPFRVSGYDGLTTLVGLTIMPKYDCKNAITIRETPIMIL